MASPIGYSGSGRVSGSLPRQVVKAFSDARFPIDQLPVSGTFQDNGIVMDLSPDAIGYMEGLIAQNEANHNAAVMGKVWSKEQQVQKLTEYYL
jgi:ribulose kinase